MLFLSCKLVMVNTGVGISSLEELNVE
jgi:hypothetical protein